MHWFKNNGQNYSLGTFETELCKKFSLIDFKGKIIIVIIRNWLNNSFK